MVVLIYLYIVMLIPIAIMGAAGAYHALKYSYPGDKSHLATGIYVVFCVLVLIASFILIGTTNWSGEAP